jgi:hypothetical protein
MYCLLCVCAADGRGHAAVSGQPEWARGVHAGAIGRGRSGQPGEGLSCKVNGTGLSCAELCRTCVHACIADRVRWDAARCVFGDGGHHDHPRPHHSRRIGGEARRDNMMCPVHAVWCFRPMGPRRCTSPARLGMWSAFGRCWVAARQSTRRWWVAQAQRHGTGGCVRGACVFACAAGWVGWDAARLRARASERLPMPAS